MSYDLFAQAFVGGGAAPASDLRPAILEALAPFAVDGPDEQGFCRTRTPDGGEADFYLGDGDFMVNHFSPGETLDLIFRAARAAGLVILAPDLPAVLTEAEQAEHLPNELREDPAPVLLVSGAELGAFISGDEGVYESGRQRLSRPGQAK